MVFGYWAILTAIICVVGFSWLVYASFSEDSVEVPLKENTAEESTSEKPES